MAAALAEYLRWLRGKRGRSGRITSPRTVRAYTSALPTAFAGIRAVDELAAGPGRERLRVNMRTAWGAGAPSTWNARRAAVASALAYFATEGWLPVDPAVVLDGLDREPQPKPDRVRARPRGEIDALIADRRHRLEDRTLWAMLYASAARVEEVLRLDVADLDRPNRRARVIRKGGRADELMYDIRTARLLGQLLAGRSAGPVFLSTRVVRDGTAHPRDVDPATGRRRMGYRTVERRLGAATGGWDPHDLRHSRLTHAGEDGATEADLMLLSGHEDRRTLQRYLHPTKEGAHRRLDDIDARRGAWTPTAADLADRIDRAAERQARTGVPEDSRRDLPDVAVYDQLLTRPRPTEPGATPGTPTAESAQGPGPSPVVRESVPAQPDSPPVSTRRSRRSEPEPRAWAARVNRWATTPGPLSQLVNLTRDPEFGEWTVTDRDGTHLGALLREVRAGGGRGRWTARDRHGARVLRGPWKTRDAALVGLLGYYIDHHDAAGKSTITW